MSPKIIVSYDGTANEDDAIALGRLLAQAGGEVSLAYVRHIPQPDSAREALSQSSMLILPSGRSAMICTVQPAALEMRTRTSR